MMNRRRLMHTLGTSASIIAGTGLASNAAADNHDYEDQWKVYDPGKVGGDDDADMVLSSVLRFWGSNTVSRPIGDREEYVFDICSCWKNITPNGDGSFGIEGHSLEAELADRGAGEFNLKPNSSEAIWKWTNASDGDGGNVDEVAKSTVEFAIGQFAWPYSFFSGLYDAYTESGDFDSDSSDRIKWSDSWWAGRQSVSHYSWLIVDQEICDDYCPITYMTVNSKIDPSYSIWESEAEYQLRFSNGGLPPTSYGETTQSASQSRIESLSKSELSDHGIVPIEPNETKKMMGEGVPPILIERAIKNDEKLYWSNNASVECEATFNPSK